MKLFGMEIRRVRNETKKLPVDRYEGSGGFFTLQPSPEENTTVNACVSIIADSVASLSCHVYKKTDKGRIREDKAPLYPLVHKAPNFDDTAFTFWQRVMRFLLVKGNAFIFVENW